MAFVVKLVAIVLNSGMEARKVNVRQIAIPLKAKKPRHLGRRGFVCG